MAVFFILGIIMTTQIILQLDLTTDTTGNAEQVARMIGVSAWHISGDYLIVENPLLDYRVTNNETYSHKTDRIPNGAVVILVQEDHKTLEQQIEQEIQSKNLNAPRITPEHIDSKIKAVEYILPRDVCKHDNGVEVFDAPLPLQTLTFCILTLENGFTVTGESACASPENFDAEIGKKIAYDNAREKIWLLEGYLLKEKLYQDLKPTTPKERVEVEHEELGEKLSQLEKFLGCQKPAFISDEHWALLVEQEKHMLGYYSVLQHRLKIF